MPAWLSFIFSSPHIANNTHSHALNSPRAPVSGIPTPASVVWPQLPQVTIFSTYQGFSHPLVSYSTDLSDMRACKYTLVGKLLKAATYKEALVVRPGDVHQHRYGSCPERCCDRV